ncbi:MAG: gamma-glutamyl-gamma-aminobutyrate hydrolase family protein [Planctomycetota bacterium]
MESRANIAVSLSTEEPDDGRELFKGKWLQYCEQEILHALAEAGGQPVLLPDLRDEELIVRGLELCDGLLLTGGSDVSPMVYGEEPLREVWRGDHARDLYELALVHEALREGLPVLGVCRGCQLLNVAFGGTLFQDIAAQVEGSLCHRDAVRYDAMRHEIEISEPSALARILGSGKREVNSVHHQAIKDLGKGLRAVAFASDGMIEAVEAEEGFILGIQWHPEWLPGARGLDEVFEAFVASCQSRAARA